MRFLTLLFLALATSASAAETVLPLWPEGVPGKRVAPSKSVLERIGPKGNQPGRETFIDDPSITVYPAANPNGAAVIVCPGGGYWFLSTKNEGTGVCEWLNRVGITGILLRYRTPTADETLPHNYPVQDLQRALGLVRAHAKEWNIDPKRVGVVGHSYGGKWSLFAAALHDGFACGATSDPGIVFDEKRGNVNYWERWYIGFDPALAEQRKPGTPNDKNPRTGPYKKLMADGRDLTDLHALIAPRPFFVSGGSEDLAERWKALNHSLAVNTLLGAEHRVALTTRKGHTPTEESNAALYAWFEWALKK